METDPRALLDLEDKWLQPFDVVDPFSGLALRGMLSQKPDHRYGALAITHVDGEPAPQRVFATPKLHYPFDKHGNFHFPPVREIEIYEKLDGTNVLAYRFRDAGGATHTTYKLRLSAVLRNSKWGPFLEMWNEMLRRYPEIPTLPAANDAAIGFELYGAGNPHLMIYDTPLDCALLFGVTPDGRPVPPSRLKTGGVPPPRRLGTLEAGRDPVAEYARIREETERGIEKLDDEKLKGAEGTVWYVATARGETVLFKCKPESVEAVHWQASINKTAVEMTCWNLLETQDALSFETLRPLLAEEYDDASIEKFRPHIDATMAAVNAQLEFRRRVLAAYAEIGIRLDEDKGAVMRAMAARFSKIDMKRVYAVLAARV